ncbi:hypothetical protein BCEN4_1090062 [Burkholderia cenocepacia]|nr:hypothetical protein BCEN4_1090062 [Burkholderia cenocepacia]
MDSLYRKIDGEQGVCEKQYFSGTGAPARPTSTECLV